MESHNEKTFFALDKQRTPESGGRVWSGSQVFRQRACGSCRAAGDGGSGEWGRQQLSLGGLGGGRADEHMGQESEDRTPE